MVTKDQLKRFIIDMLHLEDVSPESIGDDMPLFEQGLGLDSLDAVELVVQIKKHFGVEIKNRQEGQMAFQSVNALQEFLATRMPN